MQRDEKRQGTSFLYLLTEDIQQHAREICERAMTTQQRAQDMIQV
jgi:hypothetical protein